MKVRIHCILFAAFMLLVLPQSCKKDDETKEYMDGSLVVDHVMPTYVQPGEKYSFTPHGITAPDGTAVAYYFSVPVVSIKDTLKAGRTTFDFEVPDTLGTFTMSCTAYSVESSDKYYVTSISIPFVVVSDNIEKGSISGITYSPGDPKVYVNGRLYYARNSAGRDWFRSNLGTVRKDADGKEISGFPYHGSSAMQYIFGAYYTWEEAQEACPEGWHLPSEQEWVELLKSLGAPSDLEPLHNSPSGAGKLMANARFNGTRMWDYYRDVTISDISISAIPVGYANVADGKYTFTGLYQYSVFWTSDEYEGKGVYRYIFEQYDNVFVGVADKQSFAASVRCVR